MNYGSSLRNRGSGTEVYYPLPLHLQPALAAYGYKAGDFPVSEQLSKEVLALPIFAELGEEEICRGGADPRFLQQHDSLLHARSLSLILAGAFGCMVADELPPAPQTPKKPVTDDYQGIQVIDDYRWLEPSADPEVRKWSDQQNARTRTYLDGLPHRAAIVDRLRELNGSSSIRFSSLIARAGVLFALKTQPPKLQPYLVMLASPDEPSSARTIVDPNAIDPTGSTTIDFYEPSLDGKLVAVSLSKGGSEEGSVSVFEVSSGKQLSDVVPRVHGATAGGSLAWNRDATGFWYTRYPHAGERPASDLNFLSADLLSPPRDARRAR